MPKDFLSHKPLKSPTLVYYTLTSNICVFVCLSHLYVITNTGQLVTAIPVRLEIGHDTETGINVLSTSTLNNGMNRNRQYIGSRDIPPPQTLAIDFSPNTTATEYRNGYKNKMDLKLTTNGTDRQSKAIKKSSDFLANGKEFSQKECNVEPNSRPNGYSTPPHINGKTSGQINGSAMEYNYSNGISNTKSKTNLLMNGNTINGNNLLTNTESVGGKFNLRTIWRTCVIISFAYHLCVC